MSTGKRVIVVTVVLPGEGEEVPAVRPWDAFDLAEAPSYEKLASALHWLTIQMTERHRAGQEIHPGDRHLTLALQAQDLNPSDIDAIGARVLWEVIA